MYQLDPLFASAAVAADIDPNINLGINSFALVAATIHIDSFAARDTLFAIVIAGFIAVAPFSFFRQPFTFPLYPVFLVRVEQAFLVSISLLFLFARQFSIVQGALTLASLFLGVHVIPFIDPFNIATRSTLAANTASNFADIATIDSSLVEPGFVAISSTTDMASCCTEIVSTIAAARVFLVRRDYP